MRRLLAATILSASITIAHASTIEATIEADKSFAARSMEVIDNPFGFPFKHYGSVNITTNKIDSSDPKFGKFDSIEFDTSLDLISYDKNSDTYKFKLTFKPQVRLANGNKIVGRLNATTYFANTHQPSMEITGKFDRSVKKDELPKSDMLNKNDFMLSVSHAGELYITTQHIIPVTIVTR